MSGKQQKTLAPRLRFPDFRDAGEWEVKRLGEIGEIITGTTPSTKMTKYYENGVYPWVTPTDIDEGKDIIETKTKLSEEGLAVGRFVPQHSLLVTCIASIGKNAIIRVDGSCNQQINAITNLSNTDVDFLYYLIEGNNHVLLNAAGQGGMAILNKNDFSNLRFTFPLFPEQQKIADGLSSLDELIELEARQYEALRQHKKGLMQQLFPREGETTPRLRFPEFRDAGEWEVKRLGEVVEITGGGTPSKKNQDFWSGNIPWVSSSDISVDSVKDIQITRFITPEAIKKSATKLVPKNSILLVSRVGVGKLAVTRQKICTSQDFTNLTPRKYDALFLAYYLKSISHVFESFNQGMAIQGFTKEDVESLELALPNLESGEQQKIADCLSSLDELIELEARQCEALKQHKKGLMQQLFPQELA